MDTPPKDTLGLMRLMMAETKPMEFNNWGDLLAIFALRLSEIAPKLTEDELWRQIAIGAAVYQRGFREFEAGVIGGHMLDTVRKAAKDRLAGED